MWYAIRNTRRAYIYPTNSLLVAELDSLSKTTDEKLCHCVTPSLLVRSPHHYRVLCHLNSFWQQIRAEISSPIHFGAADRTSEYTLKLSDPAPLDGREQLVLAGHQPDCMVDSMQKCIDNLHCFHMLKRRFFGGFRIMTSDRLIINLGYQSHGSP